jgi:hypothetical protein
MFTPSLELVKDRLPPTSGCGAAMPAGKRARRHDRHSLRSTMIAAEIPAIA